MIGLLILAEKNLGTGLIATVVHTLGSRPPQLEATELDHSAPPENIEGLLRQGLQKVDDGDGVLILADVYGATHTNIACRLLLAWPSAPLTSCRAGSSSGWRSPRWL